MNFKEIHRLLLLVFLVLPAALPSALPAAGTAGEYPEDIAARLQQKYDSMTSLSFSFNQRSQGQVSGRPRIGSGQAFFYKTGENSKMRWNYSTPDEQVLISDGVTFSMYFAELRQMIVTPAANLDSDLTYSFFSGTGRIGDKFHILPPDPEYSNAPAANGPKSIKLVPKEQHSQVQHIHIWVTPDSLLRRIEIRDHFDTLTVLNLSKMEENFLADAGEKEISEIFTFTPPEDTEIIRQ